MPFVPHETSTSVTDISSHTLSEMSIPEKYKFYVWLKTRGMKVNDFKEVSLPSGVLSLRKDDDGVYSGNFIKSEVSDTGEIPLKFDKKTLPEIVKMLEVKEYIEPASVASLPELEEKAEEVERPVEPEQESISVPSSKGDINITINVHKSKGAIMNRNNEKGRKSLVKDLYEELKKSGHTVKEIKSASNISELISKLPEDRRETFEKRLKNQKTVKKSFSHYQKEYSLPENLDSDEKIKKGKKAFRRMIKDFCKSEKKEQASRRAFSILKSKYGLEGMKQLKKSFKDTNNSWKETLGDLFPETFALLKVKTNQLDETMPGINKSGAPVDPKHFYKASENAGLYRIPMYEVDREGADKAYQEEVKKADDKAKTDFINSTKNMNVEPIEKSDLSASPNTSDELSVDGSGENEKLKDNNPGTQDSFPSQTPKMDPDGSHHMDDARGGNDEIQQFAARVNAMMQSSTQTKPDITPERSENGEAGNGGTDEIQQKTAPSPSPDAETSSEQSKIEHDGSGGMGRDGKAGAMDKPKERS